MQPAVLTRALSRSSADVLSDLAYLLARYSIQNLNMPSIICSTLETHRGHLREGAGNWLISELVAIQPNAKTRFVLKELLPLRNVNDVCYDITSKGKRSNVFYIMRRTMSLKGQDRMTPTMGRTVSVDGLLIRTIGPPKKLDRKLAINIAPACELPNDRFPSS